MNRILAICFLLIWIIPAESLFNLPHQRAILAANSARDMIRESEQSNYPLPTSVSAGLSHMRLAGTTDTLDPKFFEPSAKVLWEIDFTLVVFGVVGLASLLWRPRYLWRGGLLSGVGAFIFASGLSHVFEDLQQCGCSANGIWSVFISYAATFNTFVTHIAGPPILLSCICYAVFAKR